jgi:hypothetical protein
MPGPLSGMFVSRADVTPIPGRYASLHFFCTEVSGTRWVLMCSWRKNKKNNTDGKQS